MPDPTDIEKLAEQTGLGLYLSPAQIEQLLRGINPKRVNQANGYSHIEAYEVRAHLTRIFGFGGWRKEILALEVVEERCNEQATSGRGQNAKVRPGYANFAIADPPLKLVLIENPAAAGSLNHLGVEVGSTAEVGATQARLSGEGLETATEEQVTCCYAVQDKVWVEDPAGAPWEIYTVLADAETLERPADLAAADTCGAGSCGCSA